jgi:hypothetical protein
VWLGWHQKVVSCPVSTDWNKPLVPRSGPAGLTVVTNGGERQPLSRHGPCPATRGSTAAMLAEITTGLMAFCGGVRVVVPDHARRSGADRAQYAYSFAPLLG